MREDSGFRSRGRNRLVRAGWLALGGVCLSCVAGLASDFHSPFDLAYAPNGETLAVSDHAAKQIVLFKGDGTLHKTVALAGQPAGVAWSCDGSRVYVAERGAWTVTEASGGVAGGQPTGHTTAGGGAT